MHLNLKSKDDQAHVFILDNGLIGRGEHSYQLLLEVCGALSRRSIPHRVFGVQEMDAVVADDIGATPLFTCGLYDWGCRPKLPSSRNFVVDTIERARNLVARQRTSSEEARWRILNKTYRRDLARLPVDVWRRDNLVVIPSILQNQIFGLSQHLLSLPQSALPTVICQLMFPPNWTPWGSPGVCGETYYRKAFELARDLIGTSLFFTTENDAIADIYYRQFGIKTELLPIALPAAQKQTKPGGRIRLGFFGYSKSEKGFHLLPEAIEICRARNLPADFVVQVQHSNWERETVAAENRLRCLDGIEIIEGVMDSDEYAKRTSAVDVTLLPYDPERFGVRGSGLYTEAVAAGRPIVAAHGIYAATVIERGEAGGETFTPYTSVALADAIERLLLHFAEHQSNAVRGACEFADRHCGEAYVDTMLRIAKPCG